MTASHSRPLLRVHAYSVAALPVYYQPLAYLAGSGQIASFGLHSLRWIAPVAKNALLRLNMIHGRQHEPITAFEWFDRVTSFRHLRRADVVVMLLEPYDARVAMLLPIKAALRARGCRLVYYTSWHDWASGWQPRDPWPGIKKLWRLFLADLPVVCVTEAAAQHLRPRAGEVTVIPHPVDIDRFAPAPSPPSPPFRWISVARLVEGKGLAELIDLFAHRPAGEAQLTVMGDGPLRADLEARAKGGPVQIVPFDAAALPGLLNAHHGFVLNSHRHGRWEELFGMVLIEAMAAGLPVVATDCVGPRAIIRDGDNGLLVPQRDTRSLGAALRLVEGNPSLRARLVATGLADAQQRYALQHVADQWLQVLRG